MRHICLTTYKTETTLYHEVWRSACLSKVRNFQSILACAYCAVFSEATYYESKTLKAPNQHDTLHFVTTSITIITNEKPKKCISILSKEFEPLAV